MCAHSASGEEITQKISGKLYPFIDSLFEEASLQLREDLSEEAPALSEQFYKLKSEFESLRNYETKLVFPSVLKVFNTKDSPGQKPAINVEELQQLTQNKEKVIMDLVTAMKQETEQLTLSKQHPLYPLLFVFQHAFVEEKKIWNSMLSGWSKGCACFVAASNSAINAKTKI
jgi:hypothetical protein